MRCKKFKRKNRLKGKKINGRGGEERWVEMSSNAWKTLSTRKGRRTRGGNQNKYLGRKYVNVELMNTFKKKLIIRQKSAQT